MTSAHVVLAILFLLAALVAWQAGTISVLKKVLRLEREARAKLVESNSHALASMDRCLEIVEQFAPGAGRRPS